MTVSFVLKKEGCLPPTVPICPGAVWIFTILSSDPILMLYITVPLRDIPLNEKRLIKIESIIIEKTPETVCM